jgi:TonB family protein
MLCTTVTACPPPPKKPVGGTTVTVDGDPPDFPGDFDPGAPLPDPAPPEPGKFGLAWLERVYPTFRDGWAQFLEDCRLRLPPDHALNSPTLETTIELQVDADGQIVRTTRLTSSGNADFDQVAEEIVREAGAVPPPPRDLLSDDDLAYVTWLFARDRRQAGIATAELRRTEWPLEQAVPKFLEEGNVGEAAQRIDKAAEAGGDTAALAPLTARLAAAALREGLRSTEPEVQRIALDAVVAAAATGADSLAPAARELRSIADGSLEIELRARAIDGLGAIGDKDSAAMLQTILERDQGGNPALSSAAARALVALGAAEKVATTIRGWLTAGERARIGGGLSTLARAAVPGTVTDIAKHVGHQDLGVRVAACGALGASAATGEAAAWKALRKGLDDRDATVRAACARGAAEAAAAGKKNKNAYWRLVELFKDRDNRTRAAAVLAAIRLDPAKVGQELTAINKDKNPQVQAAYAEGLAVMPGTGGKPPKKLTELAGSTDIGVRAAAVRALAARSEAESKKLAAAMVVDPELEVRLAAIAAIDDVATLEALRGDATPEVAAAAEVRRLVVLGRGASLREVVAAIAEAPAEGATRVRVAGAWLRAR